MATRADPGDSAEPRPSGGRAHGSRRDWRHDLVVFVGLCAVVTLLFAVTPLDITSARIFYRPNAAGHWPFTTRLPWSVLYRLAPWVTASLVLGGLAGLAAGIARRRDDWRRNAAFVLLSVVLGPGIIINGLFKDHWNRPRPRDIVEFGGTMHYAVAPLRGEGGASFPCGHCSVGFLYGMGWWTWRRRRPPWAVASLSAGLIVGTGLGIGRMAAGGHFLSDAVWSALIAFGVAHSLYNYVLRIPAHESRAVGLPAVEGPVAVRQRAIVVLSALGGVGVLLALFVTPHGAPIAAEVRLSSLPRPPQVFEVTARTANIGIVLVDAPAGEVSVSGELHGFGLPTSRLRASTRFVAGPVPTLQYRIEQDGWFTDLDGSAAIRIPAGVFKRIVVRLESGNIEVTNATRDGVVAHGELRLDLQTKSGRVRQTRHL
ncbi:MAG: phosphatase PAP2 family protein [Acidobacteriia bacterium]|nr:phosphatase PAP2 family protein [Terriglobia bacterium]